MRLLAIAALLAGVGMPFAGLARTGHHIAYNHASRAAGTAFAAMAPADEYFGRQKESILEIRNRLDDIDRLGDDEVSARLGELDDLRDAILDWRHKYPHDPWLPRMLERLNRDFHRAGGG